MPQWFEIVNTSALESPSPLIYKEQMQRNIAHMIALEGSAERLFVHVKTNKMPAVVQMMVARALPHSNVPLLPKVGDVLLPHMPDGKSVR